MDIKELYKLYQQHQCITTDSRDCPEGSIFLALKGESFNGNKFAMQALEKGCSYAIVDEDVANDPRIIKVDDCLQTFKDLAREHRRQFDILARLPPRSLLPLYSRRNTMCSILRGTSTTMLVYQRLCSALTMSTRLQ